MRFLLVAATELEIAPLVARLTPSSQPDSSERLRAFTHGPHQGDVLTTGVGMVATAAWCGRALARRPYEFAVNLGVCGSFDLAFPLGTVVNVLADCIAELGAEDGENFLTVRQLGLLGPKEFPFRDDLLVNPDAKSNPVIARLPGATAITVNTVHGNEQSIARVVERFQPLVETMEGAAFMY